VRRIATLALAGAFIFAGCGQSKDWPNGTNGGGTSVATAAATATPTPTPRPTATPRPTVAAIDADWILVEPAGKGFTSMWPGEPTLNTSTSSSAVGKVTTDIWTYEANKDLAYFVALAKYPKGAMTGSDLTKVYDGAIKGMVDSAGVKLELTSSGAITVNEHAGRGFTLTGDEYALQGALILVGDTLYMAYVAYSTTMTDMSEPEIFFNDFNLTV
jgi:hypothetical protein